MGYSGIFKQRRVNAGLTQGELSKKLRCSITTVSSAERPHSSTKQVPSAAYISKFARFMAASESDRIELERALMVERALVSLPEIVAEQFRESLSDRRTVNRGAMPLAFRRLVERGWRKAGRKKADPQSLPRISSIIDGEVLLSRDDVVRLAEYLASSSDNAADNNRYLIAAQYMTDQMVDFYNLSGAEHDSFLRDMLSLPREEFRIVMDIFLFILNQHKKLKD